MMSRRNVLKILCIGLMLAIAITVLLVFYTKRTLQKLILRSLQKELHLPLSEWNKTVIKRFSHLEVDLQHLRQSPFWLGFRKTTRLWSPVFDNIHFDTFQLEKYALAVDGFIWELWCCYDPLPKDWIDLHNVTAPVKSPSIMGILAANRIFLGVIGSLNGGMLVYGGENVELSLRRHHKPYALDLSLALKHNALRVAEIWMDEHKYVVYMAWNIPLQNTGIDFGDISSRMALRKKLKCKTFDWYLKNVYPNLKPIHNIVGYGRMKNTLDENICLDQGLVSSNTSIMYYCHEYSTQNVYYHLTGEFYVGPLIEEADPDDHCLTDPGNGEKPTLKPCSKVAQNRLHIYWDFKLGRAVMNRATKRCLEMKKDTSGIYVPVLQT